MKNGLKYAGLLLLGLVGVALYLALPEYQWFVGIVAGGAVALNALHELVTNAVRRVIDQELRTLRQQGYTNTERLEGIDRKVSAVLKDLNSRK